MPRGGRRSGTPGAKYSNRSDLAQAPRAATGQTYGRATEQIAAQRAVPVAGTPTPAPVAAPQPGQGATPSGPLPGSLGFTDPTQRPNEPVTAGLATGPGAGPEALTMMGDGTDVLMQLREAYRLYPNNDTRRLIERLERGLT